MSDEMPFPDTVEEFLEQYKVIDTEQWFEHVLNLLIRKIEEADVAVFYNETTTIEDAIEDAILATKRSIIASIEQMQEENR